MAKDLLVFALGSATCGVWEEDISSAAAPTPLHRLPLSPPAMAGLAVINGRSAAIFDLAACLGLPARGAAAGGKYLLIDRDQRMTGFLVDGSIRTARVENGQLRPVPAVVRTDVVRECAVVDGGLVPVVEITVLHDRLEQGLIDPSFPPPFIPLPAEVSVPSAPIRSFTLGREQFCAAGDDLAWAPAARYRQVPFASAPGKHWSVLLHEDAVVPVADLGNLLGLPGRRERDGILFATIRGQRYGFLAGEDRGTLAGPDVLPLPPSCRTAWCSFAAVAEGIVMPLVDLAAALAQEQMAPDLVGQYRPASDFPARFRKGSVEILDFTLRGVRYALPRDEVKEIIPLQSFRTLSGTPEIVLGAAERGGKLYPVLDLAAVFGQRSRPGGSWKMLRVSNGDFQALVLAEAVDDDRILEPELQRTVPIRIPHDVLYGCYLDERAVRLILNVYGLTVHFEKTEVREMVASLVPEAARPVVPEGRADEAPAGTPLIATEEQVIPPAPSLPDHIGQPLAAAPAAPGTASSALSDARTQAGAEARAREEQQRQQEEAKRLQEETARRGEAEAAARKAAQETAEKAAAEQRKAAEEAERLRAEAERRRAEEDAGRRAEEKEREENERARIAAETAAKERAASEATAKAEAEARRKAEEERLRQEAERRRIDEERRAAEDERRQAEERAAAERRRQESARKEEAERAAAARLSAAGQQAAGTVPARPAPAAAERSYTTAAVIGILAVIAAIFLLMPKSTAPPDVRTAPPAAEQVAKKEPEKRPEITKGPEAPLYLNVPAEMPKPETVVYVVKKGDTLWGISKRFTGNPFNYPRVARDNSIATPDLIFPGQRIKLVQGK